MAERPLAPPGTTGRLGPAAQGHLAMLTFSAAVAGSFSLGSMVANEIAPAAITSARFLLASLLIGAIAAAGPGLRPAQFRAPWRYLILGGLFSVYFVLMFEGLKTAPPVSSAAVFTLTPAMSALFGWLLLRQVITPRMAAAITIGAAGALWVIFRADLAALLAFRIGRGEAIFFLGCIAHAAYTPMVRRLNRGEPAVVFTFGTLVAGFALLTAWGWRDIAGTGWAALPWLVWVVLAYITVFATALSFVLVQFSALRLPSAKVMAYTYLVPSWVTLWEVALGNRPPPLLVGAGIALTVLALVLLLKDEGH